ncbi:Protein CBG00793 [Caenorhabditis briggsae]|uniref:Protein CBG00793 n=1 Tax=Caenorhabditis briggsae TaxID=6238 RepID=A8WNU4_CAEBR|nr:Protein CBG00793 [Caenorhabditis briggsae]CAP22150.1 Protein CBG00793 [Caenorhabditis briggsae]
MLLVILVSFLAHYCVGAPRNNDFGWGANSGWYNWPGQSFGRDSNCGVRRDACLKDQGNVLKRTESTNWKSWDAVQSFSSSSHKREMKTVCDRYLYMPMNFAECFQKLNSKNSQCWQNYIPVPHTSCSNLFGQDNCVKSDIVEVCGQSEWTRFRDKMIVLMTSMHPLCVFNTDL